jgi:hypothetical protein
MKTYSSVEAYAEHVRQETARVIGVLCHRLGPEHPAAVTVGNLLTESANIVQQQKMREEIAGGYDLAALRVDAASASNSETPFEND